MSELTLLAVSQADVPWRCWQTAGARHQDVVSRRAQVFVCRHSQSPYAHNFFTAAMIECDALRHFAGDEHKTRAYLNGLRTLYDDRTLPVVRALSRFSSDSKGRRCL